MRFIRILIVTCLLCFIPSLSNAGIIDKDAKKRGHADALFDQHDYMKAKSAYSDRARNGDKFAQYRLSIIEYFNLDGHGDKVKAAAWAGVAQENKLKPLQQLFKLMWDELDAEQRIQVKEQIAEWDQKFGVTVLEKRKRVYPRAKSCTGSRVGANCDRVVSSGLIWEDQGNYYQNDLVAYTWTNDDLDDFLKMYADRIYADFSYFDQRRNQSTKE